MDGYRITRFAQRVGVAATTLRFYEQLGLLPSARTPAGYRVYSDLDADRVRFITAGKHLGLALAQIRDLLGVWDGGRCREIRDELQPMVAAQITAADTRVAELQLFRGRLAAALQQLRELPARDGPCDPTCAFLHHRATPPATSTGDNGRNLENRDPNDHAPDAGVEYGSAAAIACSLDAAQYTDRANQWRRLLGDAPPTIVPDGITVHLDTAQAGELAGLVAAEQQCCPFLTFTMTFTAGHIELTARAPQAARPLLDDLFGVAVAFNVATSAGTPA